LVQSNQCKANALMTVRRYWWQYRWYAGCRWRIWHRSDDKS